LQKRRAILAAKQQIIEDVIKKTNAALKSLSNDEYFDLIGKNGIKVCVASKWADHLFPSRIKSVCLLTLKRG
jgi:vacuolar-type H+-ATPase subunit E/Vma4